MHSLADSSLCPDGGVEPATLAYGDDALTTWWATQTGQEWDFWEFLMQTLASSCLLYTSDAADDYLEV